jgi:plasmid stabilization system protein ParE
VTRRLELRPEASADIAGAFSWYEAQREGLGREFAAELDRVFAAIRQFPAAGPIVHRSLRRALMRRFPYAVYYLFEEPRVEIRGVLHNRRNPATRNQRA